MRDRRRNHGSRKLLIAVALGPICAAAADLPVREVTSQATRAYPLAAFRDGYMFWLDKATVQLFAPQGYAAFARVLNLPGGASPWSDSLAVDSDGSIAIAVSYKARQAGAILLLDKNGLDTGFIDTGRYLPSNLSFGEDHSLWSFGSQSGPEDYQMVRRYNADRKETGRNLARSLFPNGLDPGAPAWQEQHIVAARDKVGLLAYSGQFGYMREWVELDLNGNLLRRVPITKPGLAEFAFTSDGHLYWRKEWRSGRLSVLSTTTPDWLDAGPSPFMHLMGADGDLLVYSKGLSPVDLHWFAQPTSKGP